MARPPRSPYAPRVTPAELDAARDRLVPDVAAPGLRVLFCGINPGLLSAALGRHFARPGNRFWPVLHLSGFTSRLLRPDEQDDLLTYGLGITNVVPRASARADELTDQELRDGGVSLQARVERLKPRWLAVAGITAYRTAFHDKGAQIGRQERTIAGTGIWALPNPSGLNARWTVGAMAEEFARLRVATETETGANTHGPH
ncbi:G/U mismatch-specific DNA glycosylase [Streptomyces sp. NBC_01497]|uniref:G/U mismatch-specific DNA glycosylase n=1 Tax=Streptomyces sp. NBC_01497 TaxID=2903885 RepID=UPI002E2EC49D|nr:G/U mismatch-specific DNA glycosylase [Streptomyces sp. NBC_01497]